MIVFGASDVLVTVTFWISAVSPMGTKNSVSTEIPRRSPVMRV